ncbi:Aminodeoxychorismate lyase [Methylobacterium adhaesivum]|uniref:Probable branched-chain-amino-acid aminotransferase n=1 Tax=Methylobacterium adhaesivum TaxID=333297 RepID=A0ABT8BI09_9HYPH|nr:aminotransferase class IV [Methylobacterium adhaesivum]MDN3591155.1 aminotransferase class IV [Methylobacterium adhaesivum]GJD31054.1 Aminodeoxychorismate lyase [Methylobacterium adhaesivum]
MPWFDGALVEGPVPFDLSDRGLTLGDGVFDTALAIDGRLVFEAAHVARLAAATQALGFFVDPERMGQAMRAVAGGAGGLAAVRTTVTRGSGPRGLAPPLEPRPVLWASAAPLPPALPFASLTLHETAIRRNDTSPAARWKTLGYLDAVLAAAEARAAGFDEALFCNTRGRVACAGTGNLFAVFGSRLVTPPLSDGVLAGIVRAEVLALAPKLGFVAEERPLEIEDVLGAEAVFLTNSLRGIAPVRAIGATPFAAQPAVTALSEALRAEMGL